MSERRLLLKVDRNSGVLVTVQQSGIADQGMLENELEAWIANSSDAFCREIGERLLLIGKQTVVGEVGADRIDLLALDREGNLCVIELKRGDHKLQLLQAIAYAGMVSDWDAERIVSQLHQLTSKSRDEALNEIETFVALESIQEINRRQRIIIVADQFDYEVLAGAKWLNEKHGVDVKCIRVVLAQDNGSLYMTCTCVYPPQGIVLHSKPRVRRSALEQKRFATWEQACTYITNSAIGEVFLAEGLSGQEKRFGRRPSLFYRIGGKRRISIGGRHNGGYLWQHGRFPNDLQFWIERVGADAKPEPVRDGTDLRIFLRTKAQFEGFKNGLNELASVAWTGLVSDEDIDEVDEDAEA